MSKLVAKWTLLTSSERLQRSSQCLSVVDSQAWIFGGELLPRRPVDNQFDVIRLNDEKEPSVAITLGPQVDNQSPIPRVGATMTAISQTLYMFSGRGGLDMMPIEEKGAFWRYTPKQSRWELIVPANASAPYPCSRSYHAMTSDGSETIYIHAGCPEKGRLSDLWAFNVTSRTWTELPAAPSPPRGGTSIAAHQGKLYRMNGFDGQTEQGGALDIYDVASSSWSTHLFQPDGVDGPEARSVSALLPVKVAGTDYVITLFGERDPSSLGHAGAGKMLGDIWACNLESKKWCHIQPTNEAPAPRGWFDADVLLNGPDMSVLIVHGGLAEDNSRLGDVWLLDLS
ncbi:kelch repeat protein [Xylariales sp. PMI_506]|nr:kelch repeat protein [Xylariales sp. PMI_506]